MMPTRQGSFRLFRLAGIDVFLHWSWFLIAIYSVTQRAGSYSSFAWNVVEYLTLFGIVLMHEFGHALACRQVGGRAEQIVLWPLGGVAYVAPPQRPGAMLWSIAAGPLVNVILVPVLTVPLALSSVLHGTHDLAKWIQAIWVINLVLLIFNLLPIYPLDGGQILRALLWFMLGRSRSLMATSIVGFAGVAVLFAVAVHWQSPWLFIMAAFILLNCWGGLLQARLLARASSAPRRAGFLCPACQLAPPQGPFWMCSRCRKRFDTFQTLAVCPNCRVSYPVTQCLDCGALRPIPEWMRPGSGPPPLPVVIWPDPS